MKSNGIKFLMRILLVVLLSFIQALAQDPSVNEKDVKVLTDQNFDTVIQKSAHALVEFYAPWCGHCKTLQPNYAAAATALAKEGIDVILAKVDATVETKVATQLGVSGYPSLKWFVGGSVNQSTDYTGGRETQDIIKWIKSKTGPVIKQVSSVKEVDQLKKENEVTVVAYVKDYKGSDFKSLEGAAKLEDDVTYIASTYSAVAKAYGLKKQPSLAVVQNFEGEAEAIVQYSDSKFETENIDAFVQSKLTPILIPLSQKYYNKIFGSKITKQILVIGNKAQLSGSSQEAKAINNVATKYQGQLIFVSVDKDETQMQQVLQFFGVHDITEDVMVVGFSSGDSSKYLPTDKFSESFLNKFAQDFIDDKLTKTLKSAALPDKEIDEDGVTVVVGKNYEQITKDGSKAVLLEIYAPWCGHCKSLAPILSKLAKDLKSDTSIVISKMDGTENDSPDVAIQGYPSIVLFPAGQDKTPISFSGDRTFESLKKFILSNAQGPAKTSKSTTLTDEL